MPSPRNGTAGSPVPPATPALPFEADDAEPGEVARIKVDQRPGGNSKYGPVKLKPHKPDRAKMSWIEIQLLDESDQPVPGEPYQVTLPDGVTVGEGSLDEKGFARIDGIDPGTCQVCFPKLDQEAWERM